MDQVLTELVVFGLLLLYCALVNIITRKNAWLFALLIVLGISGWYWLGVHGAESTRSEEYQAKWAIVLAVVGIGSILWTRWHERPIPEDYKEDRDKWEDRNLLR